MSRILLCEHAAPLMTSPSQWKVEVVTPKQFGADLIESYVANTERRYAELTESLLNSETLTEEQVKRSLAAFKDSFVLELKEAHKHERLRVSGPAQVENLRNGNGRVYPTALWDSVLDESSDFMERVRNRQTLGELEHPSEGNTKLPRVSHLVEKVWRDSGVIYAQHLIFRTPNGQIVEELYRAGAVPGVSSRGAGSTKSIDGVDVVEASDFVLDTWDFVAQPSVATARPSKIGESDTSGTGKSVSERVIHTPSIVRISEPSGVSLMAQSSIESARAIAVSQQALQESTKYLLGDRHTLSGLLEQQNCLIEAATGLSGQFTDEYVTEVISLRAKLSERLNTLRREITRLAEEDDDPPQPPADDKDNKDDAPASDDAGSTADSNDDQKAERLMKSLGVTTMKNWTLPQVFEAMAARILQLEDLTTDHVPNAKYRKAIELGEAVLSRANSDRQTLESRLKKTQTELKESKALNEATRTLLEATVVQYRGERVQSVVESLIQKNPRLKPIEKRLRECKNEVELKKLIETTIKPLYEGSRTDLPPTYSSRRLSETKVGTSPDNRRQPSSGQNGLMEMLTASEQGRQQMYG